MRHYGTTKRTEAFLSAIPEELRGTMARRMEVMYDIGRQTARMEKDQWKPSYLDEFWKHSVHLRQEKLLDYLPKKMSIYDDYKLKDEKGEPWDDLRGERAITGAIKDYINRNGGDYQLVKYWMSAQGGDSWSTNSQALKYWIAQQRNCPWTLTTGKGVPMAPGSIIRTFSVTRHAARRTRNKRPGIPPGPPGTPSTTRRCATSSFPATGSARGSWS
jgi:hypothetical protein